MLYLPGFKIIKFRVRYSNLRQQKILNRDYLFFLQQLCRDWSKKSNTNTVQPQDTATSKTALVSDGNGKTSPQQPTSAAIKKVQNQYQIITIIHPIIKKLLKHIKERKNKLNFKNKKFFILKPYENKQPNES